jgi:hypothetical protein
MGSLLAQGERLGNLTSASCKWLAGGNDPEDRSFRRGGDASRPSATPDELPYLVELWDEDRKIVEQVLAVAAHGSVGYAAYYAALREYPDRYVTLRLRNRTIARSNEPRQ